MRRVPGRNNAVPTDTTGLANVSQSTEPGTTGSDSEPLGGKSNAGADLSATDDNSGGIGEPESILGIETAEPVYSRVEDAAPRLRKDGKPDGRGKRRSKGSAETQSESDLERLKLSALLYSAYAGLASFSNTPEFKLEKEECAEYAEVLNDLAKEFGVLVSRRTVVVSNAIAVIGKIHITRLIAISIRKKGEKLAGRPAVAPPAPVFSTTPQPQPRTQVIPPKPNGKPGVGPGGILEMSAQDLNPDPYEDFPGVG